MEYTTIKELIALAGDGKISDVVLACQAQEDRQDKKKLIDYMRHCLHVMEESVQEGMQPDLRSAGRGRVQCLHGQDRGLAHGGLLRHTARRTSDGAGEVSLQRG